MPIADQIARPVCRRLDRSEKVGDVVERVRVCVEMEDRCALAAGHQGVRTGHGLEDSAGDRVIAPNRHNRRACSIEPSVIFSDSLDRQLVVVALREGDVAEVVDCDCFPWIEVELEV